MAEPLARLPRAVGTQRSVIAVLIALVALVAVPALAVARESRTLDLPPVGERVRAIASGGNPLASCAIRADLSLVCWLDPGYIEYSDDGTSTMYLEEIDRERLEQMRPPAGEFLAVSVGEGHACAVRTNHEVACWGTDYYGGETMPPKGEFSAVAVGWSSSCAIRIDKTLACWGVGPGAQPPAGTFTSISAGQDIYCGLQTDRTATCWGGAIDTLIDDPFGTAPQPPSEEFTSVAVVLWFRACGIRTDATVACWSSEDDERAWMDRLATQWLGQAIAIGDTCAVRFDRSFVCFDIVPEEGEVLETHAGRFKAVSGRCAIRTDDTLYCANYEPGVGFEPPATDMASTHPTNHLFWMHVLLGLCAVLAAGTMTLRLERRPR